MTFTRVMRICATAVLGMDAIYFALVGADAIGWMILTMSLSSVLVILEIAELMHLDKEKAPAPKRYAHARDAHAKLLGGNK